MWVRSASGTIGPWDCNVLQKTGRYCTRSGPEAKGMDEGGQGAGRLMDAEGWLTGEECVAE